MRSDKLAIIPPKDSDPIYYELNLHNYHDYLHYLQNIANRKLKDRRLELVDISKGLIEVLQNTGFTIEMILEYGPSQIAEKLGIDDYIAQIIFKETIKAITSFNKSIQKVKE